jgi:hypothetical protein
MSPSLSSKLAAGAVLAALAAQIVAAEPQKLAKRYVGVDFETDFSQSAPPSSRLLSTPPAVTSG